MGYVSINSVKSYGAGYFIFIELWLFIIEIGY